MRIQVPTISFVFSFFDYDGNARQEVGEPPVADVTVALDGVNRTCTNSTGWYVISDVTKDVHKIRPFH